MSVILYEYKEFEGVYDELVNIPKLENIVMNNTYVKKYNSNPMPSSMKYKFEGVLGRLLWYMYVANRVAYSLQYQENEDIFTPEETAEKYTIEEAKQKFASFMYNIYTNNGTVFLSKDWIGLAQDINYFLKYKMEAGGTLPTPFGQAGLVGETGAMNEMDMFAMGGGLPQGVQQYYANTYNPAYPTPHGYAKGGSVGGRYLISLDGRNDLWRGNDYDEAYDEFINQRSKYLYKMDVILIDTLNDETLDYYDAQEDREQDDDFAKGGDVKMSKLKKGHRVRVVNTQYDGKEGLIVVEETDGRYGVQVDGKIKGIERENLMLLDRRTYAKGGEIKVGDKIKAFISDRDGSHQIERIVKEIREVNGKKQYVVKFGGNDRYFIMEDEIKSYAKGGMMQGYNDRLDESLGNRDGVEPLMMQSYKDRRDESKGMEKSMGRRAYQSVGTMDKKAKGGKTQGYNDKLDESLGNTKGKRSTKEQNYKDRRNESEAMEKKGGKRKYARVKTMDKGNRKKRQTPMSLAKEIRKEGEKWQDAVKRASAMLKKK